MAARCLACGYTMQTGQEVQSAILATFHTLVDAAKALGADILKGLLGKGPEGLGAVAGVLNVASRPVRCPQCQAAGRWEDT